MSKTNGEGRPERGPGSPFFGFGQIGQGTMLLQTCFYKTLFYSRVSGCFVMLVTLKSGINLKNLDFFILYQGRKNVTVVEPKILRGMGMVVSGALSVKLVKDKNAHF